MREVQGAGLGLAVGFELRLNPLKPKQPGSGKKILLASPGLMFSPHFSAESSAAPRAPDLSDMVEILI